jgi:septum formation protein
VHHSSDQEFVVSGRPSRPLVLASASPRRLQLLRTAGFEPRVIESDLDDADVVPGRVSPEALVMALAWFKAQRARWRGTPADAVVLAADTMCVHAGELLGKPRDSAQAADMLRAMRGRAHRVVTGVALVAEGIARVIALDSATVHLGAVADDEIDNYVRSGQWRGKAGGYNYSERVHAGWPLSCDGDPTGVMGLPMVRVVPLLERFSAFRCCAEPDPRP